MSLLINNNASQGLQALAKALLYSKHAATPASANTNVQPPVWQNIQSQSSSSWNSSDPSGSSLNVKYSYTNIIKTDLSMVGNPVTIPAAPADSSRAISSVSSGYDMTATDIDNS